MVVVRDLTTSQPRSVKKGKLLGFGAYRDVRACGPDMVVKHERYEGDSDRANEIEVEVWQALKGTPAEKYLCPIIGASDDSCDILQQRVCKVVGREMEKMSDRFRRQREKRRLQLGRLDWNEEDKAYKQYRTKRDETFKPMYAWLKEADAAIRAEGWYPNDLHEYNIGQMADGSYKIIDFGNFRQMGSDDADDSCSCSACRRY